MTIGDLVKEGTYPFHSRFNRAANFSHGDRLVSVVDETIGDGPLNIVLPDFDAGHSRGPLQVFAREVIFEGRSYSINSRYCSTIAAKPQPNNECHSELARNLWNHSEQRFEIPRFARNDKTGISHFKRLLVTTAPPKSLAFLLDETREQHFRTAFERAFVQRVKQSVNEIFHGDRLAGIRQLKGAGPGLTPSGDDFIAGHLIGLNLRGEPTDELFEAARSDNIFSNTFLDLARQGRVFGRMKNLILALMTGRGIRECAERLFAVGGTSGADLATGFYMTVRA
jgi:hypothetical protein